jgi:molybdenum cofactor cytidylyltransferase
MKSRAAVIFLGGGDSIRMGYPKIYLPQHGSTFLQELINAYRNAGVDRQLAVINSRFCGAPWNDLLQPLIPQLKIVQTPQPNPGRLHSIQAGIRELPGMEFCFIQDADRPLINTAIVKQLWSVRNSWGYASPVYKGKNGHPILLSRCVMDKILSVPDADAHLNVLLRQFPRRVVEAAGPEVLVNINTPDDYRKYIEPAKEAAGEKCV